MAELAAAELPEAEAKADGACMEVAEGRVPRRRGQRGRFVLPGAPRRHRRRGGGAVRARPVRDVPPLLRDQAAGASTSTTSPPASAAGSRKCIVNVKGNGAYRHLRFEGGGHRVQRVPETEAQGRIHTSRRHGRGAARTAGREDRDQPQGRRRIRLPRRRPRRAERQQGRDRLAASSTSPAACSSR